MLPAELLAGRWHGDGGGENGPDITRRRRNGGAAMLSSTRKVLRLGKRNAGAPSAPLSEVKGFKRGHQNCRLCSSRTHPVQICVFRHIESPTRRRDGREVASGNGGTDVL
eukprot:TRINITY_DN12575_c0_g1_i1.p1 TRINITY_DN12575_c0_g1~~TRINITY_DN12575_c0_g1_i1.p1  ORF type:complete len:110 (-),score=3.63 TRINITY_DN12575_c0_g1_i1:144-473(-)